MYFKSTKGPEIWGNMIGEFLAFLQREKNGDLSYNVKDIRSSQKYIRVRHELQKTGKSPGFVAIHPAEFYTIAENSPEYVEAIAARITELFARLSEVVDFGGVTYNFPSLGLPAIVRKTAQNIREMAETPEEAEAVSLKISEIGGFLHLVCEVGDGTPGGWSPFGPGFYFCSRPIVKISGQLADAMAEAAINLGESFPDVMAATIAKIGEPDGGGVSDEPGSSKINH
jgi:hypothetical protein